MTRSHREGLKDSCIFENMLREPIWVSNMVLALGLLPPTAIANTEKITILSRRQVRSDNDSMPAISHILYPSASKLFSTDILFCGIGSICDEYDSVSVADVTIHGTNLIFGWRLPEW